MAREKEKKLRFKSTNWDAQALEPEAAEGKYRGVIDKVTISSNKHQYPMMRLDLLLKKAVTKSKAAQKSKGSTVADFISFFPDGDRRGNMAKKQYQNLAEQLSIPEDILPAQLASERDFDKLVKFLKKKQLDIWVTTSERDGEPRANAHYTEPRGFGAGDEDEEEEEEEEEEDEDEDEEEEEEEDEDDDDDDDDEEDEDDDEEDEDDDDDDDDDDEDEKPKKKGDKKKGKKK